MEKDLTVESHEDKRHDQRYRYNSPMSLYRMDHQDQSYYAEMKDYSKGGLSLLSNEKLVVDQLVYFEMKDYDKNATGPEKNKSYSGSVKWVISSSSSNSDAKAFYKYGIEYHHPLN